MNQAEPLISIECSEHKSQLITTIDTDCNTKKLGYCIECILESHAKGTFPQNMTTPAKYLQETSDFYNKCRQRVQNAGNPPVEYTNELSKKAERLEMLSKHIDQEKQKVTQRFEEIRKNMLAMIEVKEKECVKLDDEISGLSDLYTQFEETLAKGWTKSSDIDARYPNSDALQQRMSKMVNLDQLQTFMKGITEERKNEKQCCKKEGDLEKLKGKINSFINYAQKIESSSPDLQGKLLNVDLQDLQNLTKELLKEFSRQEIRMGNSIALRVKEFPYASQIINSEQDEVFKGWLPNPKDLSLKLLYRGSEDGMSAQMFHEKCDNNGATVTLIKCRFEGAVSLSVLGGFIDKSWNSNGSYISSNAAFIFSLTEGTAPIKCSIFNQICAGYGDRAGGPAFGGGHDLCIKADFISGYANPHSYANANALRPNNQMNFTVEEIEVFQVKY